MSSETSIDARVAALSQKSPEELSAYVDGIFTKLQRNLEHNTRVFQERSNELVGKVAEIERNLTAMLARLDQQPKPTRLVEEKIVESSSWTDMTEATNTNTDINVNGNDGIMLVGSSADPLMTQTSLN